MKIWYKSKHTPTGTQVTCSMQDGGFSASATVKSYVSTIPEGMRDAKSRATKMLTAMQDTAKELE